MPNQQSLINPVPRKVVGQNPQPSSVNVIDRSTTIKDTTENHKKDPIVRSNTLAPKDVFKDSAKKDAKETKDDKGGDDKKDSNKQDDNRIKNGPSPTEGIQFENKNLLIYYKR